MFNKFNKKYCDTNQSSLINVHKFYSLQDHIYIYWVKMKTLHFYNTNS